MYPNNIIGFDIDQVQSRLAVFYLDGYYKVDIMDLQTLEIMKEIDTRTLSTFSINSIAFSAKDWLCFYQTSSGSRYNLLYHIPSGRKHYLEEESTHQLTFSKSGKYMAVTNQRGAYVYTFHADGSISKNFLPGDLDYYWQQKRPFVFDPVDEEKAYYIDNSNTTYSIIKQVNTADVRVLNSRRVHANTTAYPADPVMLTIDPYTGYFGGSSDKAFFVYDFHSDQVREVVPKAKEAYYITLLNHTLYSPAGIRLALKK